MLIDKEHITRYLPQRPPFVMIDELHSADENGFKSAFQVSENNLFLANAILSESALVENIAQTCAAGFGYVGSQKGEEAGRLGFIGAVSRLQVFELPQLSDLIETEIQIVSSFDSIHLVQGTARKNGKSLLECQLKIVLA